VAESNGDDASGDFRRTWPDRTERKTFAQAPIGLCATAGAKLSGATTIITVDGIAERLEISRCVSADVTINFRETEPVLRSGCGG